MSSITYLGRVQPIYLGDWNSTTNYNKLENVLYAGNSYISRVNMNIGHVPPTDASSDEFWVKIASKGNTGEQGVQGPEGSQGIQGLAGSITIGTVQTLDPLEDAYVTNSGTLSSAILNIGIPRGIPGEGAVSSVDGYSPGIDGNVILKAVRYGVAQTIGSSDQSIARANIGAQAAGNYPVLPTNYIPDNGQILYYNNGWATKNINEVPSASVDDDTKYLRRVNNVTMWDRAYTVPPSNAVGVPLIKIGSALYDYGWGTVISSAEINSLFSI